MILAVFVVLTIGCYYASFIRIHPQTQSVGFFTEECYGVCKVNYTISDDSLIVDRFDNISHKRQHMIIKGDFRKLKFDVPLAIILHPRNFGCPDCNDGGALTMGFTYRGRSYSYALDSRAEPWYFKDMGDKIADRVAKARAIAPYKD